MGRADFDEGLARYRAGQFPDARDALERAVVADPSDADAWMLLGLSRRRLGESGAAIDALTRAVASDPEHGPARANLGAALLTAGRFAEADGALTVAVALLPSAASPRRQLAVARLRCGDLDGAFQVARELLAVGPDPEAGAVAAEVALRRGATDEAAAWLERAGLADPIGALVALADEALRERGPAAALPALREVAARSPDRVDARVVLGRALRDGGDLDGALAAVAGLTEPQALAVQATILELRGDLQVARDALERAVPVAPDDGAAWHNLARLRLRTGDSGGALAAQARAIADDPSDRSRWIAWVDAVAAARELPVALEPLLVAALDVPGVAVQGLERALRLSVEASTDPQDWAALVDRGDPGAVGRLAPQLDRPLVHGWLRRTRAIGPAWERRLTALRGADLLHRALDGHPKVRASLAIQAIHTGHAWDRAADEERALADLDPADPAELAIVAAWRDLPSDLPDPGGDLSALHRLAVVEPAVERALAAAIPTLGVGDDPGSAEVRSQYEQHPYPRLISVHIKPPAALPALLRQIAPHVRDVPDRQPLRVLIAGCGTGQQIVTAATRYLHARVLAVDLSRASLGVAARKVREYGLDSRVRLLRADLLALGDLDERFDVVECGGVLHHLRTPVAGLRVLAGLLAPGGLMKLGVYSEVARRDVVAARALLDAHGVGSSPDELRRGRRILRELPADHPAHPVCWSPDFPSLAGFRDLARHACEHRYTLDRLADELAVVGLELLAFQHPDPRPAALYAGRFPGDLAQRDLARWALIEAAHPECFRGMYQFWCRLQSATGSASIN
jgi:tetratricopeptide (TPR) repeat protein/SAM-dependent methyltransferase